MKLFTFPNLIKKIYKNITFEIPNPYNAFFLTFDDCTNVNLTLQFLKFTLLNKISATFFCIGEVLQQNPFLIEKITEKHTLGNHTYSHLNAFKTKKDIFLADVQKFQKIYKAKFFRPPYGKITNRLAKKISELNLKTILWTFLTYDFEGIPKKILEEKTKKILKNGTIVVLHLNNKTNKKIFEYTEIILKVAESKGLKSQSLSDTFL